MSSQPIPIPEPARFPFRQERSTSFESDMVHACQQHIDQHGWTTDFERLYGGMPEIQSYEPQHPPEFCHGMTAQQQRYDGNYLTAWRRGLRRRAAGSAAPIPIPHQVTGPKVSRTVEEKRNVCSRRATPLLKTCALQNTRNEDGVCGKKAAQCSKTTSGRGGANGRHVNQGCDKRRQQLRQPPRNTEQAESDALSEQAKERNGGIEQSTAARNATDKNHAQIRPNVQHGHHMPRPHFQPVLDPEYTRRKTLAVQEKATRDARLDLKRLVHYARSTMYIPAYRGKQDGNDFKAPEPEIRLW